MSKIFVAFLAAILLFAFVPTTQAQSFTEMARQRLAMGPGGNRQSYYGQRGYSRRNGYNTPDPNIYDRGYDTPDRGHHQATQNNQNWDLVIDGLNLVLTGYNAWETRELNRKFDDRMRSEPRRPRSEQRMDRDDYYEPPVRRAERQPEPEPPVVQPPTPPLEPQQTEVLNASPCEVVLYINGSYLLALKPGERVVVPTLVGLTAAGNFNGKMGFALINPFSTGAVITAPKS